MKHYIYIIYILSLIVLVAGCSAEIGDSCSYDIDCSPNMNRNCDNSQPDGYCLILSCFPDQCPNESACIEFTTPSPEDVDVDAGSSDSYDAMCDQMETNRKRSYCLRHCTKDSDCRSKYICADPINLEAEIIDSNHIDRGVCVPNVQ